jgi:quercetin dioxygenase-like cupin family protein
MKGQVAAGAALAAVALTGAPSVHAQPLRETVTVIENQLIPNLPGKRLVANIVEYPPGAQSVPHRHAGSAFIYAYVLSGEVRSAVGDEAARVYHAGEGWTEKPGAHHRVSENASSSEPARLLAVFVVDDTDSQLTTPDNH